MKITLCIVLGFYFAAWLAGFTIVALCYTRHYIKGKRKGKRQIIG